MIDKISRERIKELKKNKKYDEIYIEFGMGAYNKYVPTYVRQADLKKLKQEGRYEDIYNKHGKAKYNAVLTDAMYREIKETKGTLKAILYKTGQKISATAKKLGFATAFSFLSLSSMLALETESTIKENAAKYENEIEDYNTNISNYADKVNSKELNDVQVFMKVMDDMWGNIKGYATPQKDITGFLELDLADEEGYGVCRNMANDVAKKLNEINPQYNARAIVVKMGESGYYTMADIERNILETNETVTEEKKENNEQNVQNDILDNVVSGIIGNHMVTLVDISEYNLTLVLDPTNPGIGIYRDGQIIMLNSAKENGLELEAKEYTNAVVFKGGIDGIVNTTKDYLNSYKKPTLSFEEIEEKFGLEAQNTALKEVREMFKEDIKISEENKEDIIKMAEEKESISEEKSFRESLKVDLYMQESNDNSLETENNNQQQNKEEIENEI